LQHTTFRVAEDNQRCCSTHPEQNSRRLRISQVIYETLH
jgi:hypothetical protein